ncbi:uncharacterized protein ACWYII_019418 isoform 2-T3 [Salvelinus alpinus]|uniref:podocalyxin isoform X2 n=1 Tax=Salvelinus alpinus TaxID=8036 RepID=UPI0039FCE50A
MLIWLTAVVFQTIYHRRWCTKRCDNQSGCWKRPKDSPSGWSTPGSRDYHWTGSPEDCSTTARHQSAQPTCYQPEVTVLQQPIATLQQPITAFYPTSPIQTDARPKEAVQTDRRTESPQLNETLSAAETALAPCPNPERSPPGHVSLPQGPQGTLYWPVHTQVPKPALTSIPPAPVRTRRWRTSTNSSGILTVSIDNPTAITQSEPPGAWSLHPPAPTSSAPVKMKVEEEKKTEPPKGVPLQFDINSVGKPTAMTLNERFRILKDERVATAQTSKGSRFVTGLRQ